jgi:hypothetical protein
MQRFVSTVLAANPSHKYSSNLNYGIFKRPFPTPKKTSNIKSIEVPIRFAIELFARFLII